jgi:lipopolysaccharide/colanic/teichoic acid biosynthesis glycosyltransferase
MLKRALDLIIAVPALLLLSPVLAATAVAVRWKLGSPVLFRQLRPGLDAKAFSVLKFRTMRDAADSKGNPLPDEERLPPFGIALRKMSLDELPQLISVIRGDMSLVGPRPLLMDYLTLYSPEQARRHEVRPGITGWAQVNGRNAISWDEKFELDIWYVDNRSLWLDLRILALTALRLVQRKDINAADNVTMPRFEGNGDQLPRQ